MNRFFALTLSMLLWQQTALGQLGQKSQPETPEFAHVALTKSMSVALSKRSAALMKSGMRNYESLPTNFKDFVTAHADEFSNQDAKFLRSIVSKFPAGVVLPKFSLKDGRYQTSVSGTNISFDAVDYWQNQIQINGKPFKIDWEKGLETVYQNLQRDYSESTSMSGLIINDANALPVLVIWLALFIIAGYGISWYFKSAEEKRKIIKQSLDETAKDLSAQAQRCEQSRNDEAAYDQTHDLLGSVMEGEGQGNNVSKGIQVAIFRSIEEKSNLDCSASISEILTQTLGTGAGSINADVRQAKETLCGYGNSGGVLARLQGCLAKFYSTHKEMTAKRRSYESVDGDSGLLRNQRRFREASAR